METTASVSAKVTDERLVETAARLRLAIVRTARRLRQEAGTDLGPTLIAALGTVDRNGPLTPSELAELERVKRPTATRMLSRLEAEGLVDRASDPSDGRSHLVSVTRDGRELLTRLRRRKTAYLARHLRDLDAEELATVDRAVELLEELLESERS
jgi:DNA-binding MarR family transcriptional regulator